MFTHPFLTRKLYCFKTKIRKGKGKQKHKSMGFLVTTVNFALCKNYSITQKTSIPFEKKNSKIG